MNLYFPQISQIFNTESTENSQRTHRFNITFVIPKEYKRNYDFDKIKSFSRIAQITQIFNTESTEFFHREHKDCILCLSFRRNLKETMILIKLKISR